MKMENMKPLLAFIFSMIFPLAIQAQNSAPTWIEEVLYSTGKYNTVTAVVGIIVLGIAIWLFLQDRKLNALEEKINGRNDLFDRS